MLGQFVAIIYAKYKNLSLCHFKKSFFLNNLVWNFLSAREGKSSGALDHPKQPGYLHWGPGPPQSVVCSSASYCNNKYMPKVYATVSSTDCSRKMYSIIIYYYLCTFESLSCENVKKA
jgi:hypothetical protein